MDVMAPLGIAVDHLPAVWALPVLLVIAFLAARASTAGTIAKVVASLCIVAGGVHLAIIPTHLDDKVTAVLFVFNGVAFLGVATLVLCRRRWRLPAFLLAVSTVAFYTFYVLSGRESADTVGVVTTLIEVAILIAACRVSEATG